MVILVERFKFPFGIEVHSKKSKPPSATLRDFRSEISDFLSQFLSKTGFDRYFELIQQTNNAFAKLVLDIEHPMSEWGAKTREQYLGYSLNLLDLLNAISSSISHLNQSKISNLHALRLVQGSPSSAAQILKKVPKRTFVIVLGKNFEWSVGVQEKYNSRKETAVIDALAVVRRIGVLTLGLVLSSLCDDPKPYEDVRKSVIRGADDSLIEGLDSTAKTDGMIQEVNAAVDRLSAGKWGEDACWDMKNILEMMENTIQGIEKRTSDLFSEVLATRNQLLRKFLGRQNL